MTYIFYSNYNDWQYQTGISLVLFAWAMVLILYNNFLKR